MLNQKTEKGQAIVLIVFAIIGLVGMTGLAVDGGRMYAERIQAQNAAENAALAGALALCRGRTIATDALAVAAQNGFDDNGTNNWVDVEYPPVSGSYIGLSNYIEVVVRSSVPSTFAQVIYDGPLRVTGRSVSMCDTGVPLGSYNTNDFRAVWAGAPEGACNPGEYFDWSGSDYTLTGGAHSNGDMKIGGSGSVIDGNTTVVGDLIQGSANFNPPLVENASPGTNPLATLYTFSRFNTGGDIHTAALAINRIVLTSGKINPGWLQTSCFMNGIRCLSGGVLQDGIYVSTNNSDDAIEISDGNIHGDGGGTDFANVTFVANPGRIKFSGSSNKFNPYIGNEDAAASTEFLKGLHGITAATWGQGANQCTSPALSTSGSNSQFGGFFYAPNGMVELNGSSEIITGCIISYTAKLNGSSSTITCDETWFPDRSFSISVVE